MLENIDDKLIYAKDLRPSTAKKIDSIVDIISEIAKAEYERGKEDEKRWWSGFCANCTDSERPQGKWIIEIDANGNTYGRCSMCGMKQYAGQLNFCPDCGAKMKGASNEAISG